LDAGFSVTDAQIEKVLAEGLPVRAVLLSRGGWLAGDEVTVELRFAADATSPAVWRVGLSTPEAPEPWHAVFVEAATIVGISVRR
jgi:hypothetical protein